MQFKNHLLHTVIRWFHPCLSLLGWRPQLRAGSQDTSGGDSNGCCCFQGKVSSRYWHISKNV